MSNEPLSSAPSLEIDLAQSFLPAWAKESGPSPKLAKLTERFGDEKSFEGRRPRDGRPGHSSRPDRRNSDRRDSNRRPERRGPGRRDDRPRDFRSDQAPRPEPVTIRGWEVRILSEPRGVDGLAKQIRTTAKAYPLFDLAQLILEKPERFLVEWTRKAENAPALFQVKLDGSLWLNQNEAVGHLINRHRDVFYRSEKVTVEPPKGNYACVAQCGLSDELLGPPNHHDYSEKVRKLHAARFARIPFEEYKSRIRMLKDEEAVAKWKEEQSTRDEFQPLEAPADAEPIKLANLAEVERHFRANHLAEAILNLESGAVVPGRIVQISAHPIRSLVRRQVEDLRRHPLPLVHQLGNELASKGLQIFKAHENITYASIARPRYLDRQASPVAEGLSGILDYLEANPKQPRAEQWKGILAARAIPDGGTEADREAATLRDLSLLLHEGYVIDYALKGLEAARRPKVQPPKETVRPAPQTAG